MKPEDAPRLPTALENVDTGILMDANCSPVQPVGDDRTLVSMGHLSGSTSR
jgi:hypothetical protein